MSWTLIHKQILTSFVLLCMIFTSSIAQAMSLSMMLNANILSADIQDSVSVSDAYVMPCHQVQVDTQSDQNKQRSNGCVHCQFCTLANAQAIQTTLLNTAFDWRSDDYHLTQSPALYSQHYPPAIRPPII